MFSHSGAKWAEKDDVMFRRVRQVAAPGAKLLHTIALFSVVVRPWNILVSFVAHWLIYPRRSEGGISCDEVGFCVRTAIRNLEKDGRNKGLSPGHPVMF